MANFGAWRRVTSKDDGRSTWSRSTTLTSTTGMNAGAGQRLTTGSSSTTALTVVKLSSAVCANLREVSMDSKQLDTPVFTTLGVGATPVPYESVISSEELDTLEGVERIEYELTIVNEHIAHHRDALRDLAAEVQRIEAEYRRQLADVAARRAQLKTNIPNLVRLRSLLHQRRHRLKMINMDMSIRRRKDTDPPPQESEA